MDNIGYLIQLISTFPKSKRKTIRKFSILVLNVSSKKEPYNGKNHYKLAK